MKRYQRSPHVLSRAFAGQALVALPGEEGFESLTGPGYAIWILLEEPRTPSDLVSELAGLFEEDEDAISADVDGFLRSLQKRRLIEMVS